MKSLLKKGALSARRRVTHQFNLKLSGRTAMLLAPVLAFILSSCNGDTNGQSATSKNNLPDSLTKPKVDIKVNRHYDEKGNVIGFDSTYTSYYSNYPTLGHDTLRMDSLMGSFDSFFKNNHSMFFQREFDPLFFPDSSRYPDFFHNDFFLKRYELNDPYFRGMMHRMDSIKNNFYKDQSSRSRKNKT